MNFYYEIKLNFNDDDLFKFYEWSKNDKLDLIKNIFDDLMFLIIIILFISTKKDYLTLIIFISIYNYYKESLNFFGGIMPSLLYFKDILNRIKSIFDLEPDINNINYTKKGHIIVNNLNYSYNTINSVITSVPPVV